MFDISALKAKETEKVILKDKDGIAYTDEKGEELYVLVYGPASKVAQTHREKMILKAQAKLKSNKKDDLDIKKNIQENKDFLKKMTVELSFTVDGKKGDEAIAQFYDSPDYDILSKQVDRFLSEDGNFMPSA